MAEFKLGRIRFVWKDEWIPQTVYFKDDVIRYGGQTYVCVIGHTSDSDFYTDLNFQPSRWNLMADGHEWREDWTVSTAYNQRDVVRYGGTLYIANTAHVSAATTSLGLEEDLAKWDIFVEGLDWKGSWETGLRYKKNDLVRYGGYTYVCNEGHTSAATISLGLEVDQSKWDTFNPGFEFKGDWDNNQIRYKVNDVVKYGAGLWLCVTQHESSGTFESQEANWTEFVKGFEFEDFWSDSVVYQPGDVVRYGGNQFVAKTNHSDKVPTQNAGDWALFTEAFNFRENWSDSESYRVGDVVRLNGLTYLATNDNIDSEPPSADWERLTSGFEWKNEWTEPFDYKIGDAVKFSDNSYVCVAAHTSQEASNNQPDLDLAGNFWNILTVGNEIAVLQQKGDLVFFSGSGPARLPVGVEGQLLRAGEEFPEWVSLNFVDHVYYVAPEGVDKPAPVYGLTQDKPWKSVRYACEQVLKGARNSVAQKLLEYNRIFIQREVTEFIQFQINNAEPGSIWDGFSYDSSKCERDVGFIVDRLKFDIGLGGNLKIRSAVQTLLNVLDEGPFSTEEDENGTGEYLNLSIEGPQSVLAYEFMLDLILTIFDNQQPAVNYQQLNSVADEAEQYIDPISFAETKAISEVQELMGILITALDTQDPATIPDRRVMANLIKVATGEFFETLPIIVPAFTCVIGDELRSTTVTAAGSLIDPSDVRYTVETFDHVADIFEDIVQGNAIAPTQGNEETQFDAWPTATSAEGEVVSDLVQVMKLRSDWLTNSMSVATLKDPVGYDSGFAAARKLVKENKKFLAEETLAFLIQEYPDLRYSKTLAKRDVGLIVDALVYDLTYGGNALSIQAGLAYYGGEGTGIDQLPASIKQETVASLEFLRELAVKVAGNEEIGESELLQTKIPQFRSDAGSSDAVGAVGDNIGDIIAIVVDGPDVVGNSITLVDPTPADGVNTTTALIAAFNALDAQISTIATAAVNFINTEFPELEYSEAKAARDTEIVLKAAGFDFMFDINYQTVKAAHAYLREVSQGLYDDPQLKTATRASLEFARSEAVDNVDGNADAIARLNAAFKLIDLTIFGGSNEGSICPTEVEARYHASLQLERNKNFIVKEVEAYIADRFSDTVTDITSNVFTITDTSWLSRNTAIKFTGDVFGLLEDSTELNGDTIYYVYDVVSSTEFTISTERNAVEPLEIQNDSGSMNVELAYNKELCLRDVETYIDAAKFDLVSPGNYQTRYVARYYANAVIGSQEEDMYYLRNACGLRNMTTKGLHGDLTPENEFGTSRVTAGAYASLDPGWGPDDFTTWIVARSPYIQNVTTLGTAAIGQKIDGALHAGGNDSIVSNDFTQVISDGIGAWVANNGRAELVSVFTYYAHIGYLSTEGGRIRGTNGNNSYGTFGSVAEGVDDTEIPNTAIVDNRFQFVATVDSVFTTGAPTGNMLAFEFENAGLEYTEVDWVLLGGGFNAEVEQGNEFRDGGAFQVRLLETAEEGEQGEFGGFGYLTNENTSQGGDTTGILLAAVDQEITGAYDGMKLYITGGPGAGQFGIVQNYNAGTKQADIFRETRLVDASGLAGSTLYIIDFVGTTDFTAVGASANEPGIIFEATGPTTGTGRAVELEPGWDNVVPGRSIVEPTGATTYIVEPRLSFTSPQFLASTSVAASRIRWDIEYAEVTDTYVEVEGTSSGIGTGAKFNVTKRATKYFVELSRDEENIPMSGSGYERLDTITLSGSDLGGDDTDNDILITITSVSSINGEIQAFDFAGTGLGGYFVATSTGATFAVSKNGETWTDVSTGLNSEQWDSAAAGRITKIITPEEFVIGRSYTIVSIGSTNWQALGAPDNQPGTTFIATAQGAFTEEAGTAKPNASSIVVASSTAASDGIAYSLDGGLTWDTPASSPAGSDWRVGYGAGRWILIQESANNTFYSDDGGLTWTAGGTLPAASDWTDIAYGKGVWVALRTDSDTSAKSTDGGITWEEITLPTADDWDSITYGNNRFVAIVRDAGDSDVAAYSLDGTEWVSSSLPSSQEWTDIAYGQGIFLASCASSIAAISEDGIRWTQRSTSPVSANSAITFGSPAQRGVFVGIALVGITSSGMTRILAGATTKARAKVADQKIFAINILEPGSGYVDAPTMTIGDANVLRDAPFDVRIGNGVLANPSFIARGTQYTTGSAVIDQGDGFAENFQPGSFVAARQLTQRPVAGSNLIFGHLPDRVFKVVNVISFLGEFDGSFTAFFQISPPLTIAEAPESGVGISTRIRYSQTRLTGHDFLSIGTGNFEKTNYPRDFLQDPEPANETVEKNGGRVFFTSTDQDGNFRVGELFTIEQSTGVATLNADAFNIAGLQELNLGTVQLGGSSAVITEFSTDPFFTADSDNVIPTQRAVKAFIASQIGGGGASLNVNTVTAGTIFIGTNVISSTVNGSIKMNATFEFTGGVTGLPIAFNYFLT